MGNPIKYADPLGLYLPFWHYNFTVIGATNGGMSFKDASKLASMVVKVDKGTQEPYQSHMHAMCAKGLSKAVCEKNFSNYVNHEFNKCTKKGLARVIHAWQDFYSRGHSGFHEYSGLSHLPLNHPYYDGAPTNDEAIGVPLVTQSIVQMWKEKCQCGSH